MPITAFPFSRVAFATLLLTGAAASAQTPPPAPRGAAPAASGPTAEGPMARARPPAADDAAQTTLTGRVARWLLNPNGEVDGLLLDDGTQVAFPPHLSARVTAAVKLHDSVLVTGRSSQTERPRVIRATQIRGSAAGQVVTDEPPADGMPPAPRDQSALTAMKASGRISTLLHTGRGDVNGVVLDSGTVVRFPPHAGTQFTALLKTDGTLYAQGYGTRNAQGSAFEATQIGATADSAQAVFPAPPGPRGGPDGERAGPGANRRGPEGERPRPPVDGAPRPLPDRPAATSAASAPR